VPSGFDLSPTDYSEFGWIHNESVYFLGKVHLACRYLYSIFKFGKILERIHNESVYLDLEKKCSFADGKTAFYDIMFY
jgi:hypothetical protein